MSLQINDTTNYRGIAQVYEDEIGANRGDVTGNTAKYKDFIAGVNLAMDDYVAIAIQASGTWQYDDSNHTGYPIIKTNLVQGQRDYTFTTDEQGNLILDIQRVLILGEDDTEYQECYSVDAQSEYEARDIYGESTAEGAPYRYDKTANGFFLDPTPGYNKTNGLKVYINREGSYFTTSDTTKKPGVPGLHHKYFALKPALDYARRKRITTESSLRNEVQLMEQAIKDYFGMREKDKRNILKPKPICYE